MNKIFTILLLILISILSIGCGKTSDISESAKGTVETIFDFGAGHSQQAVGQFHFVHIGAADQDGIGIANGIYVLVILGPKVSALGGNLV